MAQRYADLRCTILELPAMCQVALECVAAAILSARVDACELDMFRQPWPLGYDALLLSNVLHDWNLETCAKLLSTSYRALSQGGRIYVHEMLVDDSCVGPRTAVAFSILMLLGTEGRQFSFGDLCRLLVAAGFSDIGVTATYGY